MYLLELGGEDDALAVREAASACSAVERLAPGLATARGLSGRVRGLALTRRACELVGTCDADVDAAAALLRAATFDRSSTVAVRARDVRGLTGVSTQAAERALGGVLVDRGFDVDLEDPDHELRAYFSGVGGDAGAGDDTAHGENASGPPSGTCALGWLVAGSVRDYGDRKPTDRPFFQPGSMDPLLARALANVAGARPGATLLDPMCGTGGILVEAGLVGADVLGVDAQRKMARGARRNLAAYLGDGGVEGLPPAGTFGTARGDATRLPVADDSVDAVVFDAPYGRQSPVSGLSLEAVVAAALAEARRVSRGRAVVVGDRAWVDVARDAGWTVESSFERRVHRSLTRHVLVLAPGDASDG